MNPTYDQLVQKARDVSLGQVRAASKEIGEKVDDPDKTMEAAEELVKSKLKDPDSARFRNVRVTPYGSNHVVCGEVNGKNAYGGYVGFTPFVAGTMSVVLWYHGDSNRDDYIYNAGIIDACGR